MSHHATPLAQRSQVTRHFAHSDMDYYLKWIRGRAIYQGSDADECRTAVAQITDGDSVSWQSAWSQLALDIETKAQGYLTGRESTAARDAYLRACTYYRAALFLMPPLPLLFCWSACWQRS